MKVDKRKFDEVLGKLIKAEPQKRAETKPEKKPQQTLYFRTKGVKAFRSTSLR